MAAPTPAPASHTLTPNGGIEFPIAFLVGAFAIQVLGPGAWAWPA